VQPIRAFKKCVEKNPLPRKSGIRGILEIFRNTKIKGIAAPETFLGEDNVAPKGSRGAWPLMGAGGVTHF